MKYLKNYFVSSNRDITLSLILLLIVFSSTFVPLLIRMLPVFAIVVLIGTCLSWSKFKDISNTCSSERIIYIALACFSIIGIFYFVTSFLSWGQVDNYFYENDFIIRQSYFVFLFPLFILAGMTVFSVINKCRNFFLKYSFGCLLIILLLDVISAFYFGNSLFKDYNGYTYWLDKALLWFFVCYLYFFSITYGENKNKVFAIVSAFFFLERVFGYGQMFNASTGALLYVYMALFYVVVNFFSIKKGVILFYIWMALLASILFFVFTGPFYKEFFDFDLNTYWRLKSWYNNLIAVIDNYGFGVGFGVSYFPTSPEVYDHAVTMFCSAEKVGHKVTDLLFIRGQHSSFINVFFRLGFFGMLAFLAFYVALFKFTKSHCEDKIILVTLPLVVCCLSNIAFHVGLESPPYLITASLATGFLIEAISYLNKLDNNVSEGHASSLHC